MWLYVFEENEYYAVARRTQSKFHEMLKQLRAIESVGHTADRTVSELEKPTKKK